MKNFFEELKRRNVIKAAIAYVVVAWVVLQVISILAPLFEVPAGVTKFITVMLFIGFPVWVIFSWVYEATTEGVKRTSEVQPGKSMSPVINKRLNILIVVMLAGAIGMNLFTGGTALWVSSAEPAEALQLEASIAVLPFDNESPREEDGWFSEAMTTDVQSNLAKISELVVISKTSTERYRNSDKSLREIMEELQVNYILEGDVSIYEGRIRINVQLLDHNDRVVWSEVFREKSEQLHQIQERISRIIADKLKVTISPEESELLQKIPTTNPEAYKLVIRAEEMMNANDGDLKESISELLDKAIALDSNYADAYALKARHIWWYTTNFSEAEQLTRKSLELDPKNVHAYANMTIISGFNRDFEQAYEWTEKALQLKPNDAQLNLVAYYVFSYPKMDDTLKVYEYIEKAHRLDPLSININQVYYQYLNQRGLYAAANDHLMTSRIGWNADERWWNDTWWQGVARKDPLFQARALKEQIEKDPDNPFWYVQLGNYYNGVLNDNENALLNYKKAFELNPEDQNLIYKYSYGLAEAGDHESALNTWDTLDLKKYGLNEGYWNVMRAELLYLKGDYEAVLDILDTLPAVYNLRHRLMSLSQQNDQARIEKFLKENKFLIRANEWVLHYAIQENRDSLYYYLNHPDLHPQFINSRPELDTYRNEERYRDFLRKHHFPIPGEYDPSELEIKRAKAEEIEAQ